MRKEESIDARRERGIRKIEYSREVPARMWQKYAPVDFENLWSEFYGNDVRVAQPPRPLFPPTVDQCNSFIFTEMALLSKALRVKWFWRFDPKPEQKIRDTPRGAPIRRDALALDPFRRELHHF